jgi:LPS-assembly lipoprotein
MSWSEGLRLAAARFSALRSSLRVALRSSAPGALIACALLAACGFTLRGTQTLPFDRVAVRSTDSALAAELARTLRALTGAQVSTDPAGAQMVVEVLGETHERQILTLNAQGRAVEYTLRDRLRYRVLDERGRELVEASELLAQRDLIQNDSQRLSKESEETLLYREMRGDLLGQMLRRLAAVHPYAAAD